MADVISVTPHADAIINSICSGLSFLCNKVRESILLDLRELGFEGDDQ